MNLTTFEIKKLAAQFADVLVDHKGRESYEFDCYGLLDFAAALRRAYEEVARDE